MIQEEQNIRVSSEEMVVGIVWLLKGHEERFFARKGSAMCTLHFWDSAQAWLLWPRPQTSWQD